MRTSPHIATTLQILMGTSILILFSHVQTSWAWTAHPFNQATPSERAKRLSRMSAQDIIKHFDSSQTQITPGLSVGSALINRNLTSQDLKAVETWLVNQLRLDKHNIWIHYHLCVTYLKMRQTEYRSYLWPDHHDHYLQKAIQMAYQTSLLNSQHLLSHLALAQVAFQLGDGDKSLDALNQIHKTHRPLIADSYILYSQMISSLSTNQTAEIARFLHSLSHHNDLSPLITTQILITIKDHLSAEQIIRFINQQQAKHHSSWAGLWAIAKGIHHHQYGDSIVAETLFETAFQQGWGGCDLALNYASLIFKKDSQKTKEILSFQWCGPDHLDSQWFLALSFFYNNEHKQAIRIFSKYLITVHQTAPQAADDRLDLITQIYRQHNQSAPLTDLLTNLSNQIPELTHIHAQLAEITGLNNQPKIAQQHWLNALAFEPHNHHYHHQLGRCYEATSDLHAALNSYQRSYQLNHFHSSKQRGQKLYHMALIHVKLNQHSHALAMLKLAIKYDPHLKKAAQTTEKFHNLKHHIQSSQLSDEISF